MIEAATKKEAAKKETPSEAKLDRELLISSAGKLLGHRSADVAGALHGDKRDKLTITEAKSVTDKWLKKPVGA